MSGRPILKSEDGSRIVVSFPADKVVSAVDLNETCVSVAEYISDYLQKNQTATVVMGGHSMGCVMAQVTGLHLIHEPVDVLSRLYVCGSAAYSWCQNSVMRKWCEAYAGRFLFWTMAGPHEHDTGIDRGLYIDPFVAELVMYKSCMEKPALWTDRSSKVLNALSTKGGLKDTATFYSVTICEPHGSFASWPQMLLHMNAADNNIHTPIFVSVVTDMDWKEATVRDSRHRPQPADPLLSSVRMYGVHDQKRMTDITFFESPKELHELHVYRQALHTAFSPTTAGAGHLRRSRSRRRSRSHRRSLSRRRSRYASRRGAGKNPGPG